MCVHECICVCACMCVHECICVCACMCVVNQKERVRDEVKQTLEATPW